MRRGALRIAVVGSLVALLGVAAPLPRAEASYPVCGQSMVEQVKFKLSGPNLVYSGYLMCADPATLISIDFVKLTPLVPPGRAQTVSAGPCTSCSPLTASGSIPAAIGLYEVAMRATLSGTASGGAFVTYRPARSHRYSWNGIGDPVQIT